MTALKLINRISENKLFDFASDHQSNKSKNERKNIKSISILFDLHSKVTSSILFLSAALLSLNEYFGGSIDCRSSCSDLPKKLIEKYCWYQSVFYDKDLLTIRNDEIIYPGISSSYSDSLKFNLRYYQWVYFVLIIQVG